MQCSLFRQIFHEYPSSSRCVEGCLVHLRKQSPYQEIIWHSTKVAREAKLVAEVEMKRLRDGDRGRKKGLIGISKTKHA